MLIDTSVINEIFTFWFPNDNYNNFWFDKNLDFDSTIKTKSGKPVLFRITSHYIYVVYSRK